MLSIDGIGSMRRSGDRRPVHGRHRSPGGQQVLGGRNSRSFDPIV